MEFLWWGVLIGLVLFLVYAVIEDFFRRVRRWLRNR
jgi:hypothetical protein